MRKIKTNRLFSLLLTVLVMLCFGKAVYAETYYYGVEIQGNLVGYMEMNIIPGTGAENANTILKIKTYMKLTLMGQAFDTTVLETYHLAPKTNLPTYYSNDITQGTMKTGVTVTISTDSACFTPKTGRAKTIALAPGTMVGNPPYFSFLIKDLQGNREKWEKTYPVVDTGSGEISPMTYTFKGTEKLVLAGKTYNALVFDFREPQKGVMARLWINREDGRMLKAEMPNNRLYEADAAVIGQIKRAEIDDLLFARVNTLIIDYKSISYMKVNARILSLGEVITPESLNFPGQSFKGTVTGNLIEGIFEIRRQQYNGEGAPPFPTSFNADSRLQKYLEAEDLIEADDPVLVNKAKELTKGSKDSWEAVLRLSKWVAENIFYEIPGGSARHTYNTGKGECGSHSRLFTAFCRAVGIPARIVTGCMYTPTFNGSFGQHAWNEVYMGEKQGWIPVDSTVDETGYVDSGHIRLGNMVSFNPQNMEILDFKAKSVADITASTLGKIVNLPWEIGKTYTFEYTYKGQPLGTDSFTIERVDTDEKGDKIYTAATKLDLQGRTTSGEWKIDFKGNPIEYKIKGRANTTEYSILCEFSPGKVIEKATQSGTPIERTIPLNGQVYLLDNNNMSLWALLFSGIPMAEGKTVSFKIFHPMLMQVLPLEVKVKGREQVTVGGKELKCWASEVILSGTPLNVWVDETGRLVKSTEAGGNLQILLKN